MIERSAFGRTGHESSRVIFGAAAFTEATEEEADEVLSLLLAHGINHIDTAASYGDSELLVGRWMERHRDHFFLATKTGARDAKGARESLERSLDRLGVDQVDLIQLHNLVEEDEWEEVHASGGALEALALAREEGLVRFIGVTGHGTRVAAMHLRSLERFDYDSVLFPYNSTMLADPCYADDAARLIQLAEDRGIAVQTIKAVARRRWPGDRSPGERRYSWYQPLEDLDAIGRAVAFVLGCPGLFLNSTSDFRLLRTVLEAASAAPEVRVGPSLDDDIETFAMKALFDGGSLERM